jgi:hypothetical protein
LSGAIRSASAVSHHTSKGASAPPASAIAGRTTASGAPTANSAIATGQISTKVIPRRSG